MAIKLTDAVLQAILNQVIAALGPFNPAALFLGVATAVNDQGSATTLADITEGAGDLATREAVTPWGTPYKMANGDWVVDGPLCTFKPADATEAATISHFFYASAAVAGTLKAWGALSTPVQLVDGNSQLTIIPRLVVDKTGVWSAEAHFNG